MLVHPVSFLIFRWGPVAATVGLPERGFKLPSWRRGCSLPPLLVPSHPLESRSGQSQEAWQQLPVASHNLQCANRGFAVHRPLPHTLRCCSGLGVPVTWRPFLGSHRFSSLPMPCALHASFPRRDFWQRKSINYFALGSLSIFLVTARSSHWKFRNTGNKVEKLVECCGGVSFLKMHDWENREAGERAYWQGLILEHLPEVPVSQKLLSKIVDKMYRWMWPREEIQIHFNFDRRNLAGSIMLTWSQQD